MIIKRWTFMNMDPEKLSLWGSELERVNEQSCEKCEFSRIDCNTSGFSFTV